MCLGLVIGKRLSSFAFRRLRGTFGYQSFTGFTYFATVMYRQDIHLLESTLWRARIVPMAVCGLDASVHTVDNELGALISADLSSGIHSRSLIEKWPLER